MKKDKRVINKKNPKKTSDQQIKTDKRFIQKKKEKDKRVIKK